MNFDLFGSRPKHDPQHLAAIKQWAADEFHLAEDVPILVTELRCTEPGCPPLETVIAVMDVPGKPRQFKVHKSIAEITLADVQGLAFPLSTET